SDTTGTPATTGAPGETGDGPTTGAGSTSSDSGDSTGTPQAMTPESSGCSCDAPSTDPRGTFALLALVFGLARRRR
ncbi:MAG TPA: MYXO-CTERM sorting domain-containing protein, partial [Nannocystis sp.]